jgi:hypothetical protein
MFLSALCIKQVWKGAWICKHRVSTITRSVALYCVCACPSCDSFPLQRARSGLLRWTLQLVIVFPTTEITVAYSRARVALTYRLLPQHLKQKVHICSSARYEGIWGVEVSATHSVPRHQVRVNGRLHNPATWPLGRTPPPSPLNVRLGGCRCLSGRFGEAM